MKLNNIQESYQLLSPRQDQCIHQLVEAQAERKPDAIAVVCADEQLSYQELNRRANQLASYLQTRGVGPETLVAICLERSLEMVVAILGVLKAGGAYVPLDLAYPKERLAFMLADTQTPILLTESQLLEKLPEHMAQVVCLDTDWEAIAQESAENLASAVRPDNLAYVIYTSGSTGKPKGVLISHDNVVRLLAATDPWFHFDDRDVWTLFHSYAFDFSVWEIWGALFYGGRLVVVPYWVSRSPEAFYDLLSTERVTVLNQTPSAFRQLMRVEEVLGITKDLALRLVIFGGEALEFNSLKPWFDRHGDQVPQLVNMYGITETTVHVTYRPLNVADLGQASASLIGRPIPDLHLYILNQDLQSVPSGVPGELYVGGAGVARGYLNRPELTAERFIPNPFRPTADGRPPSAKPPYGTAAAELATFSGQPSVVSGRLYKTGDLACYLPNGDIEYLGRIDHQVKIRGFRIELGEIEAILGQHPAVQETIVLARENTSDEKQLVAYVVPRQQQMPVFSELRRFLKEQLPDYMLPSAFVLVEALPLTPNGKVDRRALPAPNTDRPELETAYAAPRTELEHFLTNLWQEILGIKKIGIYDNFFELGGDSLKGAILVNRLQAELDEYVYIVALFEAPTIADLAAYLNEHYSEAVLKMGRIVPHRSLASGQSQFLRGQSDKLDALRIRQIRQLIKPLSSREENNKAVAAKNPPAIFILSPPRSGSTLLRVMLAGHPRLFAPPELDLLSFNTLDERKTILSGGDSFRLEGTIRAIMEIKGCDAEQAKAVMTDYEKQRLTTKEFYRLVQEWLRPKMLVDKSTFYALDLETLKRVEIDFDHALYIHLLRHPYGMIHSFEKSRSDRIYFKHQHTFSARQVAELTWLICHQNIAEFLKSVPIQRQYRIKFEDLVSQPKSVMEGVCQFLGLEAHPDMWQPYKDKERKMTDGIHPESVSRMLGDVKFHEHNDIDPLVADVWKNYYVYDFLGDITWQMAASLGYRRPAKRIPSQHAAELLAQLDQLSDDEVDLLLNEVLGEEGVKA